MRGKLWAIKLGLGTGVGMTIVALLLDVDGNRQDKTARAGEIRPILRQRSPGGQRRPASVAGAKIRVVRLPLGCG